MWEQVIQIAISNGIFCVLFVILLMYQLKDSSNREKKYQETIKSLSKHLNAVEDIEEDVKEIKQIIIDSKTSSEKEDSNEKIA